MLRNVGGDRLNQSPSAGDVGGKHSELMWESTCSAAHQSNCSEIFTSKYQRGFHNKVFVQTEAAVSLWVMFSCAVQKPKSFHTRLLWCPEHQVRTALQCPSFSEQTTTLLTQVWFTDGWTGLTTCEAKCRAPSTGSGGKLPQTVCCYDLLCLETTHFQAEGSDGVHCSLCKQYRENAGLHV